jgi:hypothetical protein
MSGACCDNCVYGMFDIEDGYRSEGRGEGVLVKCANHPQWAGVVHEVPGVACRNYQRKAERPEEEGVRLIPLSGGGYAWVDAADYERLNRYHWRLANGYPCRLDGRRAVLMHREIMEPAADKVVDHIDGNRCNACRANLRICDRNENRFNQRKRRTGLSRFKGVTFHKGMGKWKAHYRLNHRLHHIGYFDDEVAAARAYDLAAVAHFGEFAQVNFPREWPPERRNRVREEYRQAAAASEEGVTRQDCRRKTGRTRK